MTRQIFRASCWVLFSTLALSILSNTTAVVPECSGDDVKILCLGGTWPSVSDPPMSGIPNTTKILFLEDVIIGDAEAAQPLSSHLTALEWLDFDNLTSYDANGSTTQFPFHLLTGSVNKSMIGNLGLNSVNITAITYDFFNGFTSLVSLFLSDCGITDIHRRSFEALAVGGSQFNGLTIVFEDALVKFPWDVLLPVASSIQVSFTREA